MALTNMVIMPGADYQDACDAVREKTGGTELIKSGDLGAQIRSIISSSGGSGSAGINDVNFRDYDGTILYSYSADEALALTAMPELPIQEGLICQGWNWSLENIKNQVNKYSKCDIGATYITDDGKTRIYIHLEESRTSPVLGVCPDGTVTVDWGDGTTPDTLTGTSTSTVAWTPTHNYPSAGDYVISLMIDGEMGFYGSSESNTLAGILRYSSVADSRNGCYQNAVQKVEIGDGVTSVGEYVFCSCHSLTNITIPNGVTSIGTYAFRHCYSLANITIPDSVTSIGDYAFSYCSSLANITIPNGVINISSDTFNNCYSLASITIPDSVTSIGSDVFYSCYSLASITIPDSVTSIGNYAFSNCYSLASVTIPDGVTSIGDKMFYYCHSLASITIPDSVTSIGNNAFSYCDTLTSVTIPDGVTSIGKYAFYYCSSLASIAIPDSVTSIGERVFYGCDSLASITIPDGVTSIGNYAFYYCYSLGKIRFNSTTSPTVLGSGALYGIPTDCIISVPTGTLSAYTSATNYPDPATYTYIEED